MKKVKKIFLAGAAGSIGRRMLPMLRDAGYEVIGTTRVASRAEELRAAGITPAILNVFDAAALSAAVAAARPDVVVHQLTDLPYGLTPELMAEGLMRNARVRIEGTRNLVDAARAAGVRRFVAQSIAFVYAPGREPHDESDPLISPAEEPWRTTMEGVATLERLTTSTRGIRRPGAALRDALTAPARAPTRQASRRCRSTRRRGRRRSRSRAARQDFTTSPRTTAWYRSRRRAANWAGTRVFGLRISLSARSPRRSRARKKLFPQGYMWTDSSVRSVML